MLNHLNAVFQDHTLATVVVILACGLGTFGLRYLPFLQRQRQRRAKQQRENLAQTHTDQPAAVLAPLHPSAWHVFSQATGAAAMAALLVAMLWPLIADPARTYDTHALVLRCLAIALGLGCTALLRRYSGNVALAALGGAAVYGALHAWLS